MATPESSGGDGGGGGGESLLALTEGVETETEPIRLPLLPDSVLVVTLSFLPTREIVRAAATVWGAVEDAEARAHHRDCAVALRLERLPLSPPPIGAPDRLSILHAACFLDRVLERRRATIAAGAAHAVCLRPGDGRPYAWGGKDTSSHYGAGALPHNLHPLHHLGTGTEIGACVRTPLRMVGLDDLGSALSEVAAGSSHTLVLTADGVVHSCGESTWGQLGHSAPIMAQQWPGRALAVVRPVEGLLAKEHLVQVAAAGAYSVALTAAGEVFECGAHRQPTSLEAQHLRPVGFDCDSRRGNAFSLTHDPPFSHPAASGDREGASESAPAPTPASRLRIVRVSAGEGHSLAVAEDGRAFGWGRNGFHQCGLGPPAYPVGEARAGFVDHSFNFVAVPRPAALPARVLEVSAGKAHSLFVLDGGALHSCGRGQGGRLGHGDANDRMRPQRVESLAGRVVVGAAAGGDHSLAICHGDEQGELWSWGGGQSGQTGLSRREDHHWPTRVEALRHECCVEVAAGEQLSIAKVLSGRLFSWGWNAQGQCGLGTAQAAARLPEAVDLPPASASGRWEMRPQWTVQCSFANLRRPSLHHPDGDHDAEQPD